MSRHSECPIDMAATIFAAGDATLDLLASHSIPPLPRLTLALEMIDQDQRRNLGDSYTQDKE